MSSISLSTRSAWTWMSQRPIDESCSSHTYSRWRVLSLRGRERVRAPILDPHLPHLASPDRRCAPFGRLPPIRSMLALEQVAPRHVERAAPRFGVTELFRRVAGSRGRVG